LLSGNERGFTLVELIIVVVIIAVAAGLTIPNLTAGARQREVRQTMQRFVSAVRRSSSVAVFTRSSVELRIDPEDGRYQVVVPKSEKELREEAEAEAGGNRIRTLGTGASRGSDEDDAGGDVRLDVVLPDGAKFGELEGGGILAEQGMLVLFYPNGGSSGGTIEIIFQAGQRREQAFKFSINPLTSAISFVDKESS
jgi:prepilin-type N-terminal cleavage/methylation domain-containing protein